MSDQDLETILAVARALPGVYRVLITQSPDGTLLPLYVNADVEDLAANLLTRGHRRLVRSIELTADS